MAENQDSGRINKSFKILNIKLKEKEPVLTSQGTFYVRYMTVSDLKAFNSYLDKNKDKTNTDLKVLGESALKTFVCTDGGPENTPALSEEIYSKLTIKDIQDLAAGLVQICDLGPLPEGDALLGLGAVLFDSITMEAKRLSENTTEIKRILDKNFGSISESAKIALGDNLNALSSIRENLMISSAVESMRKNFENQENLYKSGITKSIRSQLETDSVAKEARIHELFIPPPIHFPKLEETPVGRAAIASEESARQLREVAGLVGQMAEKLGSLHTVFLTDVLPQWVNNLENSSQATNQTLNQAERSLVWAKRALFASVVLTIFQLYIAREYKLENDTQQKTSESLMRQQLEAFHDNNKQLAADSKRLQEEFLKLSQSLARQPPKKWKRSRQRARSPRVDLKP
ncbi:MAG: hypothetical protein Q8Q40_02645 [Methylococcaceae bacterium]|nr:hypothetical protein [Methylococcaceae bacterium]MDP3902858.1 hypothetical protein [Methylococcaceae bacterium]